MGRPPSCNPCCEEPVIFGCGCYENIAPSQWEVTFSGASCSELNGTFIVDFLEAVTEGGYHKCRWRLCQQLTSPWSHNGYTLRSRMVVVEVRKDASFASSVALACGLSFFESTDCSGSVRVLLSRLEGLPFTEPGKTIDCLGGVFTPPNVRTYGLAGCLSPDVSIKAA